jgi:predicted ArsR family transcriptional regulator
VETGRPDVDTASDAVREADVSLDRDIFLRSLLRRLAGTLEDLVGLDEASGFISVVGDEIGQLIDGEYKAALGTEQLDPEQVGAVLVDLKRRIQGDFWVTEQDEGRIELRNRACPFAEQVLGRPSLCMMTSNVFGSITANNLGYARVELLETIAEGDAGCHVVVHLQPSAEPAPGREYFAGVAPRLDQEEGADGPRVLDAT